jgi:hypothetical protein
MAPTTRLEREAEDLAKEYHNASIATRSMMQAQARLTQILSKHANVAVASIASMVQDIANAKTNTALKQQELASLRAQQVVNQRKHQADLRALQVAAADYEQNKTRRNQLNALGARRTAAEDAELARRRVDNQTLKNAASASADKERKSRSAMDTLNNQMGIKTSELRNIKFTAVATAANSLTDGMQKLVSTINKTQEQFGLAAGQAANLKVDNIVSSFNSYVESAKSLFSGKPEFGVSAEMIEGVQAAYQNEFGGILTADAAKDLAMQARTMGVTAEQLTKARRVFTTQSLGNVAEAKKSQDKFIAEFAKKGLTSKDAMQAISQYSELLARNGTRFAQSFTRAAADAKKIGIDLNKVSQFGDSLINNFEGFLEGTATLGAMGFNLDSNRLAQISETGSDADLYNELKSQLASTGKDITKLRRSERLELESMFGMTIGEMQRMAGETPDDDTKSPEELQLEANGFLSKMAVGMDLMTQLLGVIANVALAAIAINTGMTAFATMSMAVPIAAVAAGIATIVGLIALWKFGSDNVEEGKRKIAAGEAGGKEQYIAGRGQKGAAAGASIAGILAGGALMATGVGLLPGLAIMAASMGAGGLAGRTMGRSSGESEATKLMAGTTGDDVVSQPGYGKRSLVTPSGVIALNNKDNIIAYADDLVGTKKLPYGSIAKKAGTATNILELLATGTQKFAGKTAVTRLLDLLQGKQFFNLAKTARGIPLLGAIASGALSGFEERQAGGGLGKSILKGLFVGGSSLTGALGAGALTAGNPLAAGLGGIAGGELSEMAFEKMFGTAKKYHKGGIVKGGSDELPAILQRGEAVIGRLQMGGLTKIIDGMNVLSTFGDKFSIGANGLMGKLGGIFGGKTGKAVTKAQELNAGGKEGLFAMAQNKFGSMFGGKAGGAMSSVSKLFTGGGSTSSNLMGMATKIPGIGGLLGKATGLLSGGGLKGIAGNLLGKVGLGSFGGSLLGGPMGLAASLAAPLLKKIPLVGGALASIAGGPGKLMSSALGKVGGFLGSKKGKGVVSSIAGGPMGMAAPLLKKIPFVGGALASMAGARGKLMSGALGKIGGLFGKKKAPAVSAMGAMMPEMGNMMSMLPFLSGAQPTTTQGTPQPQAPISVDTTGIEKQLNNFINALQGIQIHMDGAKVGKALVNSNDAASSIGVFREQSR